MDETMLMIFDLKQKNVQENKFCAKSEFVGLVDSIPPIYSKVNLF